MTPSHLTASPAAALQPVSYASRTVFYAIHTVSYLTVSPPSATITGMERLIDSEQLATILGLSPRTVDTWRSTGEGPDYIRVGGQVRYHPSDIEDWFATERVIQGNTAGREKPGPGWNDFASKALQASDTTVHRDNLWIAWNEYLANEPAANPGGPQLATDLRHALQKIHPVTSDGKGLNGIRLTTYGQDLLMAAKTREWNLPELHNAHDIGQTLAGEQYALGLRDANNPTETVIDFAQHPILYISGSGTGKTTALRMLIREITARRTGPEQVVLAIFDTRGGLHDETTQLVDGEDYYDTDPPAMQERLTAMKKVASGRKPPTSATWKERDHHSASGPLIYMLIDDLDAIRSHPGAASVLAPLRDLLWQAGPSGLRIILTAPYLPSQDDLPHTANTIRLGTRRDHLIVSDDFDLNLRPGAGYLAADDPSSSGYLQLALPAPRPQVTLVDPETRDAIRKVVRQRHGQQ